MHAWIGALLLVAWGSTVLAQDRPVSPQKTGELRGTIAYCGPGGNAGIEVFILGRSYQAKLGSGGQFLFNFVPVGTYTLTVGIPGRPSKTITDVVVADNRVADLGQVAICRDSDADGFTEATDCNDNNPNIRPSAAEACEGVDNNCDGRVDEGCALCTDADIDGFYAQAGCLTQVDCDDNDPTVRPNGIEVCDQRDNSCNGLVDEAFDLASDVNNCSACGNVCSFANAAAACGGGVCELATCASGFDDCDGNDVTGCEADLQVSVSDCGSCGNACAFAHAAAACEGGGCAIGSCDASYANCDTTAGNGCEVSLADDAANCGACGRNCETMLHGQATCAASQCDLTGMCTEGYGNCDGIRSNGCEHDLGSDPNNCGGCGVVCGWQSVPCGTYPCNYYDCGSFLNPQTCWHTCTQYCNQPISCFDGYCLW